MTVQYITREEANKLAEQRKGVFAVHDYLYRQYGKNYVGSVDDVDYILEINSLAVQNHAV